MTEQKVKKQRRSNEEILNLVREAKKLIEDGMSITPACDKVGIKFNTYMNNHGRVRTNRHLYGNKFSAVYRQSKESLDKAQDTSKDPIKEMNDLREENTKLKVIIANLMIEKI